MGSPVHLIAPALAALTILAPASSAVVPQGRVLKPSQMEEDLFSLADSFDAEHAGLHRYTSVEDYDAAFFEALEFCSQPRSELEFYRTVTGLVSLIRCGHTRTRMHPDQIEECVGSGGLLPLDVHLVGERAFVRGTLVDGLPIEPGQEILAIDGVPLPEIRKRAFEHLFADGYIETGKQLTLERDFPLLFTLVVAPIRTEPRSFQVTLKGGSEPVPASGISHADWRERRYSLQPQPLMRLTQETSGVARLFIRGFDRADAGQPSFPDQLQDHFADLRERGISKLIVDLRGNGGGDDGYGALLVSYLSPRPFRYFERIEVTEGYEGPGGIVERNGRREVTEHPGTQMQQPAKQHFLGEVVLLVDGRTFSTAADVATVVHFNSLATLVGQETGGGYDGNTSGRSDTRSLPHSRFDYSVPKWMYTTANPGHDRFGRGAPVDHAVRPSIEDILQSRDPELELAVKLLEG